MKRPCPVCGKHIPYPNAKACSYKCETTTGNTFTMPPDQTHVRLHPRISRAAAQVVLADVLGDEAVCHVCGAPVGADGEDFDEEGYCPKCPERQ